MTVHAVLTCVLVILLVLACGEDEVDEVRVYITYSFASFTEGEEPDTPVHDIVLTATGPGMETLKTKKKIDRKKEKTTIFLDTIPPGKNRTFTLEVLDKKGILLYQGETTQSLNPGGPTSIPIEIEITRMISPVTIEVRYSESFRIDTSYTISVTVTGDGMEEMTAEEDRLTGIGELDPIEFSAIPSGSNRTFTLELKDRDGIVLYNGQTTRPIRLGGPTRISIPITRITVPVTVEVISSEKFHRDTSYTSTVTVTGKWDETSAEATSTGQPAPIKFPAIPSDSNLIFTLEGRDKNGIVFYKGQTTQSISPGEPTRVSIPVTETNEYTVTVDYTQSLQRMIEAGRYDWVRFLVTQENFPIRKKGREEVNLILVRFETDIAREQNEQVLEEIAKQNLRPGTLPELLALGAKYPVPLPLKDFGTVALGSVSVDLDGRRYFTYISGDPDDNGHRLNAAPMQGVFPYRSVRWLAARP